MPTSQDKPGLLGLSQSEVCVSQAATNVQMTLCLTLPWADVSMLECPLALF